MKIFFISFFLTPIFADELSVILGNNQFAAATYKEISKTETGNFLISPFSAEAVLAFVQSGAKNETAKELRSALRLPEDQSQIETGFKNLFSKLKDEEARYSFETANKLYLQENFTVFDSFKSVANDVFHADLESINFREKVADKINQWVEENTQNKIHDLISSDDVKADTAAILINAVYFKGNWSRAFDKPTKGKFYKNGEKTVETDTMHLHDFNNFFKYVESDELDAKFLELPFQGDDVLMGFVLPNEKTGLAKLENQIDKVFQSQNFSEEIVDVLLPKFKIESKTNFRRVLENLGVKKAFTPGLADFSIISNGPFVLSDVIQKTFIDVDEDGVEAAGSTYARIVFFSGVANAVVKEFHADHPFIFYIKIKGFVAFAGRVVEPSY